MTDGVPPLPRLLRALRAALGPFLPPRLVLLRVVVPHPELVLALERDPARARGDLPRGERPGDRVAVRLEFHFFLFAPLFRAAAPGVPFPPSRGRRRPVRFRPSPVRFQRRDDVVRDGRDRVRPKLRVREHRLHPPRLGRAQPRPLLRSHHRALYFPPLRSPEPRERRRPPRDVSERGLQRREVAQRGADAAAAFALPLHLRRGRDADLLEKLCALRNLPLLMLRQRVQRLVVLRVLGRGVLRVNALPGGVGALLRRRRRLRAHASLHHGARASPPLDAARCQVTAEKRSDGG
mmetsp:Transcript_6536/g.24026  ORF Transcript_6536/g.24026 Transcript_6536/m.24026 type:complete len:293 (-) Transcript_6536:60-938(-)